MTPCFAYPLLTSSVFWLVLSPLTFLVAADQQWFHVIFDRASGR